MAEAARVELNGGEGEGGGQVVRTALALSLCTGRPFVITNLRGRRTPPGLRPQHLACVKAAETLGQAEVKGAQVGSSELEFTPHGVRAGDYLFDVGTAGSVALLFHCLCFPLALAGAPSRLKLRGGTHVSHSPLFHYLARVWAPAMGQLGFDFELGLERAGFFPEGGGEVSAAVQPARAPAELSILARGTLLEVRVVALLGGEPVASAESLRARVMSRLRERGILAEQEIVPLAVQKSRGAAVLIDARFEHSRVCFGALLDRGAVAHKVADEACDRFLAFMETGGAVDEYLADQFVLPLAISASGLRGGTPTHGRFRTSNVSQHLITHAEVIQRFLPVRVAVRGELGKEGEVIVAPEAKLAP